MPKSLLRRYDVYFKPRTKMDRTLLRSVTSQHIGCLVKLRVSCEGSWGEAVQGGGAASGEVGAVQRRDVGDSFRAAEGGCRRALRRKEQRSP